MLGWTAAQRGTLGWVARLATAANADGGGAAPRESVAFDVVVVGGGPSGLAAAIRMKQKCVSENEKDLSVCVLEKGREVGSHAFSGIVMDTGALDELFPNWKAEGAPLRSRVTHDRFYLLVSGTSGVRLPPLVLPARGDLYTLSVSELVRWMAERATALGVEIFTESPVSEVLYENGAVVGVATADVGVDKDGHPKPSFARGMEVRGKQVLFAEGARGSCSEQVIDKYCLREGRAPQKYALGFKEVWNVPVESLRPGTIVHTAGWPLSLRTYGGGFLGTMAPDTVALGFAVGLNYENPYLNPYEEFQRWKQHRVVSKFLRGGECVQYGARVVTEGGILAVPKLTFPGGALIGCSAGFVNVPRMKGLHTAMKSGMVAADAVFDLLKDQDVHKGAEAVAYESELKKSWVWSELSSARNYHPAFRWGVLPGAAYTALSAYILRGREPWTFRDAERDARCTKPAAKCKPISYGKHDGVLSFDVLDSVARSGVHHEEDQPAHVAVKPGQEDVPTKVSYAKFAGLEARFCPAGVYEYDENGKLHISASNCLHCKTCDVKAVQECIQWSVPEAGGGGPRYTVM